MDNKHYLPRNINLMPIFRKLNVSNVNKAIVVDVIQMMNDNSIIDPNEAEKYIMALENSHDLALENLIVDLAKLLMLKINNLQLAQLTETDPIFTNWLTTFKQFQYGTSSIGTPTDLYVLQYGDNYSIIFVGGAYYFPFHSGTINKIYVNAFDSSMQATTIIVDVQKSIDGGVNFTSMVGIGNKPEVNNATHSETIPTNWTDITLNAGNRLRYVVDSNTTCTFITIAIEFFLD